MIIELKNYLLENNEQAAINLLLENPALTINELAAENYETLQLAAERGMEEIFVCLLQQDSAGQYIFHAIDLIRILAYQELAAKIVHQYQHLVVRNFLLQRKIDGTLKFPITNITAATADNSIPFVFNCDEMHATKFSYLLRKTAAGCAEFSAAHMAGIIHYDRAQHPECEYRVFAALEYLLRQNPDGSAVFPGIDIAEFISNSSNRILRLACANANHAMIEFLLKKKPDGVSVFPNVYETLYSNPEGGLKELCKIGCVAPTIDALENFIATERIAMLANKNFAACLLSMLVPISNAARTEPSYLIRFFYCIESIFTGRLDLLPVEVRMELARFQGQRTAKLFATLCEVLPEYTDPQPYYGIVASYIADPADALADNVAVNSKTTKMQFG